MSLPKPYYDDGKGIVIYHGVDRVNLPHGSKKGVQTNAGTYRKTDSDWTGAPCMEGRCGKREKRALKSIAAIPRPMLRVVRQNEGRTASHRRQHSEQCAVEHSVSLPQVPYGRGWAS